MPARKSKPQPIVPLILLALLPINTCGAVWGFARVGAVDGLVWFVVTVGTIIALIMSVGWHRRRVAAWKNAQAKAYE